jgi:hypothetical protein
MTEYEATVTTPGKPPPSLQSREAEPSLSHPLPESIHNRYDAALRSEPLPSGVRDPLDIRPPLAEVIRAGSIAEVFLAAFQRGALDFGREAWRVACPECRPKIATLAWRYRGGEAA